MFDYQRQIYLKTNYPLEDANKDWEHWVVQKAEQLYQQACFNARVRRLWRRVLRKSGGLFSLRSLSGCQSAHSAPCIQSIPLERVIGSENRNTDFDDRFLPLCTHTRSRWISIAGEFLRQGALPAVELIQIDNYYFVRDGHHRVSVARYLGQAHIEAEVTVWEVNGPLPWEPAAEGKTQVALA